MGDFVKGRLDERHWHPQVLAGLKQHRLIDRFAHDHPAVLESKTRLDDRFGILKPVLIDIFYDHFLAKNWTKWVGGNLEDYAAGVYRLLEKHDDLLVDSFRPVARRMTETDWLTSYRDPEVVSQVLERIGRRLTRTNRLAEGSRELRRCGKALEADCRSFLLAARRADI